MFGKRLLRGRKIPADECIGIFSLVSQMVSSLVVIKVP